MAGCILCQLTPLAVTWRQAAAASEERPPAPWTSKLPANASTMAAQSNSPIMHGHALRQTTLYDCTVILQMRHYLAHDAKNTEAMRTHFGPTHQALRANHIL